MTNASQEVSVDGDGGQDNLDGIEKIVGTSFKDTITGDANDNIFESGSNDDILRGAAGDDTLIGEAGNDTLEENGLTENTLIIFASDNGGAGYIGLDNINKPYRGWKLTHFEGGMHIPFFAKWPAKIKKDIKYYKKKILKITIF